MEELIERLCTDKAFGILTRNGLEYRLESLGPGSWWLVLLDFCDVSKLNVAYGYEGVNEKFRAVFSKLPAETVAGICFSGDEIVLVTETPVQDLNTLSRAAEEVGLAFREVKTTYTELERDLKYLCRRLI